MSCCPPGSAQYLAPDHFDEGTVRSIDGVCFYQVGTGSVGLIMLPDVWGWNGGRIRALADDFANKGLSVWVPKCLTAFEGGSDGDGFPPNFNIGERMSELPPLLNGDWNAEKTVPKVDKVLKAMKNAGIKKFAAIGFCYGAWLGMRLCKDSGMKFVCCASPHPSVHIEGMVGGDAAELGKTSTCPWAFFPCGTPGGPGGDPDIYDKDGALFKNLEEKFPGKNVTKRYDKMQHGFVTRGNDKAEGDDVKASVQDCMDEIIKFFQMNRLFPKAAGAPPPLKRAKFGKVGKIVPEQKGMNLEVKCVKCEEKMGDDGKTKMYIAVCGDDTGIVTFDLRAPEQAGLCKPGASIRVQNARVRMTKGHIQVVCDKWASFKAAGEEFDFTVKEDKDISSTEYELKA
eukprot:TRINITY_DN7518_c0_g2_i1.p1 TRINITY_DN7518_c0_g2~~TRINITY_DN7518_c0_g2_i1.p1  ORF type:complete len:398 (+),score=114.37 TRINITY_DN7518_c0_g2_i1:95-1288(+)